MQSKKHFTTRRGFIAASGFGGLGLYGLWAAYGAAPGPLRASLDTGSPYAVVSVIGGAEIYALALPHAHELQHTEIDDDFDGDAFFPDWPRDAYG